MTEEDVLNCICNICNIQIKNLNGLSNHLRIKHKLSLKQYLEKYLDVPLCSICHKQKSKIGVRPSNVYKRTGHFYLNYCNNLNCHFQYFSKLQKKIHINNPELAENARKRRFEYLKKKTGKTAWERRAAGQMSFLEKWFFNEVILKYNLCKIYDIQSEFPVYPYLVDFAFKNIKLAVQLDGRCHFINGQKRVEHDFIKNKQLIKNRMEDFQD